MTDGESWEDSQKEELSFWGDCADTYGEETKQLVYMRHMGFVQCHTWRSPVAFDGHGQSFIDIGGGPVSVLLKFINTSRRVVIDPCNYPPWVAHRYADCGIHFWRTAGEAFTPEAALLLAVKPDMALIYNVLQHTVDPERIIKNAIAVAKQLRMFEWIDMPPHPGHPHMLTEANLNLWTGRRGTVGFINERGAVGKAWWI